MSTSRGCAACRDGQALPFAIAMAFQPIVDVRTGAVFAYEALVRGANNEGAGHVLAQVNDCNRYAFDQRCRVAAIESAARLGLQRTPAFLSINFLPNAVYKAEACIRLTLETARATGFPADRIIFEFTENESIDPEHVRGIVRAYKALGFKTALDDFGAGYAGLGTLADFQPDLVKIDMKLIRGLDRDRSRRLIVQSLVSLLRSLEVEVVAEGIETAEELAALGDMGVSYIQGFHLARPAFMALPAVEGNWRSTRVAA